MAKKEDLYRIRCERVVNESWAEAKKHLNKLPAILTNGPENEEESAIIISAALAFLQKATLEEAEDLELFGSECLLS